MPPAIIAGGVMAAGAIGGAVIGSSAQKKAASKANAAQQDATQAQLQLGQESLALNKDIYNANFGVLSPYASRGNVAGDSINALLGLGAAPAMSSPLGAPATGAPAAPGGLAPAAPTGTPSSTPMSAPVRPTFQDLRGLDPAARQDARMDYRSDLAAYRAQPGRQGGAAGGAAASPQQSAFEQFANSAGMQFQLDQGADMINNRYAGAGALQSGAAMKALQDYGQQTAIQNYFMPYMGLLGGQQAVGAGAASSIAGVGTNFGNTAANINAGMGANIQSGANAASNAALLKGQANANMWSGIGSALGGLGSSFMPK